MKLFHLVCQTSSEVCNDPGKAFTVSSQSSHDSLANRIVMVMMHSDERCYINVICHINVKNNYCLLMGAKRFLSKPPTLS